MEKNIYTNNEKGTDHKRLSSYQQAAELICACWNKLDISLIEPYLHNEVIWIGGIPHREMEGKNNYLDMMRQTFESLRYSKARYSVDIVEMTEAPYARISFDFLLCPLVHRIQIEDGQIIKMHVW